MRIESSVSGTSYVQLSAALWNLLCSCFKTMELQLALQEQGYSPEKSLLVVSIHAPIRPATAEHQAGGAAPPHQEERRGCNGPHENDELVIGVENK